MVKENVLVTGGAGFIGSWLVEKLVQKDYEVVVADNLQTGSACNLDNIQEDIEFYQADVNKKKEIEKIFSENQIDVVFHYAATVGVERTLENPLKVLEDIEGIKNVIEQSVRNDVKHLVYSSSSEVYGKPADLPMQEENTPLNSRLPYAVVKNLGEVYCRTYQEQQGLDYTILRYFNTYGPGQSMDFVIPQFIHNAVRGKDIEIYGDGRQKRTFIYIEDNIQATLNVLGNPKAKNETINVGGEKAYSINQLAKLIKEKVNSSSRIKHVDPRPKGDMDIRRPCIEKMKEILGKRELLDLEKGICKTVEYMRNGS